jgi:hypothetical protein
VLLFAPGFTVDCLERWTVRCEGLAQFEAAGAGRLPCPLSQQSAAWLEAMAAIVSKRSRGNPNRGLARVVRVIRCSSAVQSVLTGDAVKSGRDEVAADDTPALRRTRTTAGR